jgi:hypothetical protein
MRSTPSCLADFPRCSCCQTAVFPLASQRLAAAFGKDAAGLGKVVVAALRLRTRIALIAAMPISLVLLVLLYQNGGWPFDIDPSNIFIWLFLGMMIGVDRSAHSTLLEEEMEPAMEYDGLPAAAQSESEL